MKHLLAVLLMATAVAWSQPATDQDNVPPPGGRLGMMDQLNLTDAQQEKIDKLRVAFEKKQIATRAQLQSARVDLRELYRADKPDRGLIEGKTRDIDRLASDLRLARVGHWFDVYELLTPDQQKLWKEHRKMDGGRGMMRGRMMMRHRMSRGGGEDERPMRHNMQDE